MATPPDRAVGQPHHKVPVVRLGRDHERILVDAEIAVRRTRKTDLAAEIDRGARLDVEDIRRIRGVVRQIVVLGGSSADRVEDEELTVGLELEDVVGAIDGGERGRRPDRGQGAGKRGRAGRAEYAGIDQVAVGPDLGDGLLLAREPVVLS